MSKRKTRRIASNGHPAPVDPATTLEVSPLLLHPAAEQALVAVGRVTDELAKLNASIDKLIAAKPPRFRGRPVRRPTMSGCGRRSAVSDAPSVLRPARRCPPPPSA
jgi:hypothetical protein